MTEIDDKFLKQLFNEHKLEVADNGFTDRVMHHLPNRGNKLATILVTLCMAVSIVLFLAFDGLQAILGVLREVFISMVQHSATAGVDLKSLMIAGAVLLIYAVRRIYTME